MFICRECLPEKHRWKVDLGASCGPCEVCGKVAVCADLSPEHLKQPDQNETK